MRTAVAVSQAESAVGDSAGQAGIALAVFRSVFEEAIKVFRAPAWLIARLAVSP